MKRETEKPIVKLYKCSCGMNMKDEDKEKHWKKFCVKKKKS